MNTKTTLISLVAGLALIGALYGVYTLVSGGPDDALIAQVRDGRPAHQTVWNTKASHTLTVFSDYECPACKLFHDYLNTFEASSSPELAITKHVALVFRYYPLYQIHPLAMDLAYAAEAGARQGKFKEISDRFFADQTQLESMSDAKSYIQQVAKDLGLDVKKFNDDLQDKALQGVIQSDLALGDKLGINATPTFFLDGKQLDSMAPLDLLTLLKSVK